MKIINHWIENLGYYMALRRRQQTNYDGAIWFFGCSHVYGTSVENTETAPYQLSQLTNHTVINFGRPASGPMMVEHLLKDLLKKHKPLAVVIAWPSLLRWQSKEKSAPYPVLWYPHCLDESWREPKCLHYGTRELWPDSWKKYLELVKTDEIIKVNLETIARVKQLLKNIKLIEFTYFKEDDLPNLWSPNRVDLGTNNLHCGPETQLQVAKWIANEF
jgi:hypothetical protein